MAKFEKQLVQLARRSILLGSLIFSFKTFSYFYNFKFNLQLNCILFLPIISTIIYLKLNLKFIALKI
jgi:hypothetical protein